MRYKRSFGSVQLKKAQPFNAIIMSQGACAFETSIQRNGFTSKVKSIFFWNLTFKFIAAGCCDVGPPLYSLLQIRPGLQQIVLQVPVWNHVEKFRQLTDMTFNK